MRPPRDSRKAGRGHPGALGGWGGLALGLILLAGALGAARVDELPAAGAPRDPPPGAPDPAVTVEGLTEHIHGLEGKLKESAAARKAADQARMEAERRLAEGVQETDRLSAEIDLLREAKAALEGRLKRAEEQGARTTEQLTAAEESVRRLEAEGASQARRGEGLERQLEQLKRDLHQAEEDYQTALHAAEAAQTELRDQLAERARTLAARTSERDGLADRLQALRALVPAPAGGALTLEAAQAQAARAATALREAYARAEDGRDPHAKQALREAEQALQRIQFAAAQLAGARSVYRVRPGDTLLLIANHVYGDGSRWRAVRDANHQVLPDPKRLTPGLTLVIP